MRRHNKRKQGCTFSVPSKTKRGVASQYHVICLELRARSSSAFFKTPLACYNRREMTLQELATKKILLLGFAREGRDTLLFLRKKFPKKVIGIADQNPNAFEGKRGKVKLYLGK